MSIWTKEGKQSFGHIARQAEIVVIKDRDVVAFISESIGLQGTQGTQGTQGVEILRENPEGTQGFPMWSVSGPQGVIQSSERVLLWARMSGTEVVSGFRWVPYVTSDDPDQYDILPIRECYSPRVTYDRTSNMLHLWFWTNVNWTYNGTAYVESEIVPIGYKDYDSLVDTAGDKMTCKRVLCYAVGQFGHYWINGGLLEGYQGTLGLSGVQQAQYDMIPVFTRPVIITNYPVTGLSDAPGIVTDGWYGFQGLQGCQVVLDEVSINLNSESEVQIFGWETGLPLAAKSIAEILMGA
jgi:hypothetical protein